jgi:hypothetical protein
LKPARAVCEALSWKYLTQKRAGGVAEDVGPEFKLQYCKENNPAYSTRLFRCTDILAISQKQHPNHTYADLFGCQD